MNQEHALNILNHIKITYGLLKTEQNEEEKYNLAMQFLIDFEELLLLEKDQLIIKTNINNLAKDLIVIMPLVISKSTMILSAIKIFSVLTQTYKIQMNYKQLVPLILAFCSSIKFTNDLTNIFPFIQDLVSDEIFFTHFCKMNGLETILNFSFFNAETMKNLSLINKLLFDTNGVNFQNVGFQNILRTFVEKEEILTDNVKETLIFIVKLLRKMLGILKEPTEIFISSKAMQKFDDLVWKLGEDDRVTCYNMLLMTRNDNLTEPPNIPVLKYIFMMFKTKNSNNMFYFDLILPFLEDRQKICLIDNYTPFVDWLSLDKIPLLKIMTFCSIINSMEPKIIKKCVPNILISFSNNNPSLDDLTMFIKLLYFQLKRDDASYDLILKTKFVEVYYSNSNILFHLINEVDEFKIISFDVFSIKEFYEYQPQIFESLLSLYNYYTNKKYYIELIKKYINESPSQEIIRLLMKTASNEKEPLLLNILSDLFLVSKESVKNFIESKGIHWALYELDYSIFSIKDVADLLGNLVFYKGNDKLEKAIQQLPKEHLLLNSPKEIINKVIFGNSKFVYSPIRVYSLVKYNGDIKELDPYNSYYLGHKYITFFSNKISEIPFFSSIVNRNIALNQIDLLYQNPSNIYKYVDLKYDHFPLIQIYPGIKPMSFNIQFQCISFWIKYNSDLNKSDIFNLNNIKISVNSKELIVAEEDQTHVFDINILQWNHILVQIKTSLMERFIKIYINGKTFKFSSKIKSFSVFKITHLDDNILFIGPTIRFYQTYFQKLHLKGLYKKGPGYLEQYNSQEFFVTPFMLSKYEIPSNWFSVPYYGYPIFCRSKKNFQNLVHFLTISENEEEYKSLLNTILNLFKINGINLDFIEIVFTSFKQNHKFLTSSLFSKFLIDERIINYILYDINLWKSLDDYMLIESLMNSYSNIDWKKYKNIELFFIKHIMESTNPEPIIQILLKKFHQQAFIKYLLVILKIAPALCQSSCTWECIECSEPIPIQLTIIKCLIEFTNESTINMIENLFKFEEVKSLIVLSPPKLSCSIFHLIFHFLKYDPNYAIFDSTFCSVMPSLSSYLEIWNDVISLTESTESNQIGYLPLYLIFIFCGSLTFVHQNMYELPITENLTKIYENVTLLINHCTKYIQQIFENQESYNLVLNWFPIIIHYPILYQPIQTKEVTSFPFVMPIQQFSELFDPIWIDPDKIIKEISVPLPSNPPKASQFMLEKVSIVLTSNGFSIPFPNNPPSGEKDWILKSPLLLFIIDFIINSPPANLQKILYSFFYSYMFNNPHYLNSFIPGFVSSIIIRLTEQITKNQSIIQYIHFIHILTGLQYLQNYSLDVISNLFTLSIAIQDKKGENELLKIIPHIQPILLYLFSSLPVSLYKLVFSHFSKYLSLFIKFINSNGSFNAWLYAFWVASHNEKYILNPFLQKLGNITDSFLLTKVINGSIEKDLQSFQMLEDVYKAKSQEFQTTYKSLYTSINNINIPFLGGISNVANEYSNFLYISHSKHYLIANLFSQSLLHLNNSFLIKEESFQWKQFTYSLITNENKYPILSFHIWPFCLPTSIPKVMIPSTFQIIDVANAKNIRSIPIKLFKKYILYQYFIIPGFKVNMLQMFSEQYEHPSLISNCLISRYSLDINSVILFSSRYISIIFECSLNNEGDDIFLDFSSLDTKNLHLFLESLFLGQWGRTDIFASKILIQIPYDSIIHIQKISETKLGIWSFTSGNFLISCNKKEVITRLIKLNSLSYNSNISEQRFLSMFNEGKLSSLEFLTFANLFANRSFFDLENYPISPRFQISKPVTYPYPIKYFQSVISEESELPLNIFVSSDFIEGNDIHDSFDLLKRLESNENITLLSNFYIEKLNGKELLNIETKKHIDSLLDIDLLKPIKLQQQFKKNKRLYLLRSKVSQYPILTTFCSDSLIISIKPNRLCLIISTKRFMDSRKCYYPNLYYAMHISSSKNGQFLSIDYSTGITEVWKINYKDGIPHLLIIGQKSFTSNQQTILASNTYLGITFYENELITWNMFLLNEYQRISFNQRIINVVCDKDDYLWVVTKDKLYLLSINCQIIVELSLDITITAIEAIDVIGINSSKYALIGDTNGNIFIAQADTSTIILHHLPDSHDYPIRQFHIHHSNVLFISIDSNSEVIFWRVHRENNKI